MNWPSFQKAKVRNEIETIGRHLQKSCNDFEISRHLEKVSKCIFRFPLFTSYAENSSLFCLPVSTKNFHLFDLVNVSILIHDISEKITRTDLANI